MILCVTGWVVTDILKKHSSSIFNSRLVGRSVSRLVSRSISQSITLLIMCDNFLE
jgi:hypothetical protein